MSVYTDSMQVLSVDKGPCLLSYYYFCLSDWRLWNGKGYRNRRRLLQVSWRNYTCQVDITRGKYSTYTYMRLHADQFSRHNYMNPVFDLLYLCLMTSYTLSKWSLCQMLVINSKVEQTSIHFEYTLSHYLKVNQLISCCIVMYVHTVIIISV